MLNAKTWSLVGGGDVLEQNDSHRGPDIVSILVLHTYCCFTRNTLLSG